MEYGNLLSRAWKIVWANKWLFVLGFLAALGSGGGSGSSNFNPGSSSGSSSPSPGEIMDTLSDLAPFLIAGICFLILLAIGLWLLRLIGEAGMIESVDRIEGGETLTLKDGFRAGTSHLKKMVGLNLLLYGPFLLIGLLIFGGFAFFIIGSIGTESEELLAGGFGLFGLCIVPLICLLGIASLVVNFVYPMAQRGMILHDLGVTDSVRHGWEILRKNLGEILILAVIFVAIGFAVGIAIVVIALPIGLLFIVPIILAVIEGGTILTAATIIFGILGVLTFVLLSAAISSILRTFQSTTFTLAYHEWAGKKTVKTAI